MAAANVESANVLQQWFRNNEFIGFPLIMFISDRHTRPGSSREGTGEGNGQRMRLIPDLGDHGGTGKRQWWLFQRHCRIVVLFIIFENCIIYEMEAYHISIIRILNGAQIA